MGTEPVLFRLIRMPGVHIHEEHHLPVNIEPDSRTSWQFVLPPSETDSVTYDELQVGPHWMMMVCLKHEVWRSGNPMRQRPRPG